MMREVTQGLTDMPAENITIERQDYKTRGSYVATVAGVSGIARLVYTRPRDGFIVAERTESSPQFEGLGVSLALVTRMVEDARRENVKIYALCSYVEEERRRHPEWADAFHVEA
jgi:predicted GNAT family acetyltransferase